MTSWKTFKFQKGKTILTKRGNKRKVWISLSADTLKEYKDNDGNMHFNCKCLNMLYNSTNASHCGTLACGR